MADADQAVIDEGRRAQDVGHRTRRGVEVGVIDSVTVTVNVAALVLPLPSFASHVTVVTPRAKVLPEAGVQTTTTGPAQASVAPATNVTAAPLERVRARRDFPKW